MSQDSVESEIQTPDISCATVKSILCLFYTGTVVLKDHTLASEIESALTLLGCSGKVTIEKVENKLGTFFCGVLNKLNEVFLSQYTYLNQKRIS